MATKTAGTRVTLQAALDACAMPVDRVPSVSAAEARMNEMGANADAVGRRLMRFERALDPNLRAVDAARIPDAEFYEASEHIAETRREYPRTNRLAAEARRAHEAELDAERVRRRALVQEAKSATRARLIANGEAFLADLEEAQLLDQAEYETLPMQVREADAMSGGGVFPRLAIIAPEQLRARLEMLQALDD